MQPEKSNLQERIESGATIITAEISPPATSDASEVRAAVKAFAGKVHALGISDNRDGVAMSALAAAAISVSEKVEPILHMTTRDRNRTALVSDFLGARALGVRNILCTSGTHQTLLPFRTAKNVFDIDATILLQSLRDLGKNAAIVGEENIDGHTSYCLGAVASPFADPLELQLPRVAQKIFVGAQFIVTEPVFDLDRFGLWWKEVTKRGLHENTAFIAGIKILTSAEAAKKYIEKRPKPLVPEHYAERLVSKTDKAKCRTEGIAIAQEIIEKLSAIPGLRGFEIVCDEDHPAAFEVLGGLSSKIG
jgi:methylenetetrahydrofolate reductase (NADPH)